MERVSEPHAGTGVSPGRPVHLRVGAPWWPLFRLKVSCSRKVGQSEHWPALGPSIPWTFLGSPGGPDHTRTLIHSALPPTPGARRQDFWALAHRPGAWRLGRQDVQYYTFLEVGRF